MGESALHVFQLLSVIALDMKCGSELRGKTVDRFKVTVATGPATSTNPLSPRFGGRGLG